MQRFCCYILFFVFATQVKANHIVGGEIIYDKLSGNNYRITLKLYRDCSGNGSLFDGVPGYSRAWLTVYDRSSLVDTFDMGGPVITPVPPSINSDCVKAPSSVCVEEGVYTCTLNLPPKQGGYFLIYQRCCRNATVLNLVQPGTQGSTYYSFVPGPEDAAINSSPRFKKFPPIYICNNVDFSFDHSAIDPDGDELIYSLCNPYQGLSIACPALGGPNCPAYASPPPYNSVTYVSPFSGSYPISANPAFSINPTTGKLTGRPNLIGQYVVSVCIQEKRNGNVIGTHYRDFQFNVTPCVVQVVSAMADQKNKCMGNTIAFQSESQSNLGTLNIKWDFGDPSIASDTSTLFNPTYVYPDTGIYYVTLVANPGSTCADTIVRPIYVYPELNMNIVVSPTVQCIKNNSFNFTANGVHHASATFDWQFAEDAAPPSSDSKNPSGIKFTQAGVFYPRLVVKQFTCVDSCVDTIRIVPRPSALIQSIPTAMCDPAKVDFTNASTSEMPPFYRWLFSDGTYSQQENPAHIFSPAGVYGATLVATTYSICLDTSSYAIKNVTVYPKPVAAFEASPKETSIFEPEITLTNKSSDNVSSWHYTFGDDAETDAANNSHSYVKPGDYVITQIVGTPFNCRDTARLDIKILPEFRFWIPNSFTPNGDGLNDVFMPKAIGVSDYEFTVFNKWGEAIFNTKNYQSGWDGTFKGKPCEQDIYVWKIVFSNDVTRKEEVHAGHVSLLPGEK